MNSTLELFARQHLKDSLDKLPSDNHVIFKLMYGRGGYTVNTMTRSAEEAKALPIHQVVDEMPTDKLDWAMQQVDNSLRKLAKPHPQKMNTPQKLDDGGPAFPQGGVYDGLRNDVNPVGAYFDAGGMSLRDWFAGMALPYVIQTGVEGSAADAAKRLGIQTGDYKPAIHWPKLCAMESYQFADAMILERSKPTNTTEP